MASAHHTNVYLFILICSQKIQKPLTVKKPLNVHGPPEGHQDAGHDLVEVGIEGVRVVLVAVHIEVAPLRVVDVPGAPDPVELLGAVRRPKVGLYPHASFGSKVRVLPPYGARRCPMAKATPEGCRMLASIKRPPPL